MRAERRRERERVADAGGDPVGEAEPGRDMGRLGGESRRDQL
jgi:hypothetical protein